MILEVLVAQFVQRFQHEKRANVCMWFDPGGEFVRLLPGLRDHLTTLRKPPFELLEYDVGAHRGQVWLKHRIHSELAELSPAERQQRRFVIYFPLAEERLDTADERGEHHLELMEEYRTAGLIWRVGGKRPSLFRFLREAGARLPMAPAEQRRLYEGGEDSLLAKYVAKFADRPRAFWESQLTAEVVQARLLGDTDQMIIQLAIDPDGGWSQLTHKGLASEFLSAIQERYGFVHNTISPSEWVQAFVTAVALTETHLGYDEPADFPFADRLPPLTVRLHYTELLQRWLRDSEGRAAWDHWIAEVERDVDLGAWAAARNGLSFAFPHLVRLRWGQALGALEEAADKISATEAFFGVQGQRIKLEAEYTRTSDRPIGGWSLLQSLAEFIEHCREAEHEASGVSGVGPLAEIYVRNAARVERQHVVLRREAEERGLNAIARIADRHYASYTNALNGKFFKAYAANKDMNIPGVPYVTGKLEESLWSRSERQAVIIVDALRYDCALAIQDHLKGQDVVVEPMRAELPTITPIGMTALMPLSSAAVSLEVKGSNVHPKVNGRDCAQRSHRLAFMTDFGADCRDIDDIEAMGNSPEGLGDLLVVFGHDQVDHIGHGSADTLIRHLDVEVGRIARIIRKLHRWGYAQVQVVTDHGFILLEESKLPAEVACDKGWCVVLKERFALVPAKADVPLATFPCAWNQSLRVAVPPGLAFFKAEKSFSHGGAALQELVIPHLVSKSKLQKEKRVGIEVVLPTYELTRTAVKVVIRAKSPSKSGQLSLFTETPRTLALDVRRPATGADAVERVLATPEPKEVNVEPGAPEKSVTLFFHTAKSFKQGELLELDIRDVDTGEQFPPGGIKLTIGRDM